MATVASLAATVAIDAARAQARTRVAVLLIAFNENAPGVRLFRERLRSLGQVEGSNVDIIFRTAERPAQLPSLAAEIVAARPSVIVALHAAAADALQSLTGTIPIVVAFCGDPIALGYTGSWSRPTRNITGISDGLDTLAAKRVEILHELLPSAHAFGLLYEPENSIHRLVLQRAQAATQSLGLILRRYEIDDSTELKDVPARAAAAGVRALIVAPSPNIIDSRASLIAAATANRLPTMHAFGFEVVEGALIAYGAEQADNWQRTAEYVNRLMLGEPLTSLPFEQTARAWLTLNLGTARTIGLEVPASIIARADEVIE